MYELYALVQSSEPGFSIALALFLTYSTYNFMEYMDCRLSARAWWNNQRMQRIISSSAWLLAFLTVLLKTLGLSETVFEVTRKDKSPSNGDGRTDDSYPGRFTFDSSPVFIIDLQTGRPARARPEHDLARPDAARHYQARWQLRAGSCRASCRTGGPGTALQSFFRAGLARRPDWPIGLVSGYRARPARSHICYVVKGQQPTGDG
jgi:hypothetical protein